MHFRARTATLLAACWLGAASPAIAQQPAGYDSLNRRLTNITARIDSLEAGACPAPAPLVPAKRTGDARADSLAAGLDRIERRVEALRTTRCRAGAAAQPADTTDDLAAIRAAAAAAAGGAAAPGDSTGTPAQATPSQPAGGPRSANLLNPEISATGDVRLVADDRAGEIKAVAREFEFAFQSALDPFSSTKIFLAASEDGVEIEEGYIYWTGLPGKLRLDLGKYRQQVGDLNRWHLHALPETEYPLVYQSYFSAEGLSGVGLSLYTALPFSLAGGTHEIWLQGTTAESDPLFGGQHPVLLGRLQNFWQLSRTTYAQIG